MNCTLQKRPGATHRPLILHAIHGRGTRRVQRRRFNRRRMAESKPVPTLPTQQKLSPSGAARIRLRKCLRLLEARRQRLGRYNPLGSRRVGAGSFMRGLSILPGNGRQRKNPCGPARSPPDFEPGEERCSGPAAEFDIGPPAERSRRPFLQSQNDWDACSTGGTSTSRTASVEKSSRSARNSTASISFGSTQGRWRLRTDSQKGPRATSSYLD
jgi:hypothetical protein